MNKLRSINVVSDCRKDMASLLSEVIETTRTIEQRLESKDGWSAVASRLDVESDPLVVLRFLASLMLRKARIHAIAVLYANEMNNLHSLSVQMRPVLECVGQVVFMFHNIVIAPGIQMSPDDAITLSGNRMNADFYQTFLKASRGQINREQLRSMAAGAQNDAAASVGATKPKQQKSWRLNQVDKVANLTAGESWYTYLSDHFVHGESANLKGYSWQGGVTSNNQIQDEFAFLSILSYLVEQVALMNTNAILCPAPRDTDDQWSQWVEPMLSHLRDVRGRSKALMKKANKIVTLTRK